MPDNPNRKIFERYVEAFNANDIDGWASLLSNDFRLVGMGMPKSGIDHDITRDDVIATCENTGTVPPDHTLRKTLICDDDQIAAALHHRLFLPMAQPMQQLCLRHALRDGNCPDERILLHLHSRDRASRVRCRHRHRSCCLLNLVSGRKPMQSLEVERSRGHLSGASEVETFSRRYPRRTRWGPVVGAAGSDSTDQLY